MIESYDEKTQTVVYDKEIIALDDFLPSEYYAALKEMVIKSNNWMVDVAITHPLVRDAKDNSDTTFTEDIQSVLVVHKDNNVELPEIYNFLGILLKKLKAIHVLRVKFNMTYAAKEEGDAAYFHMDYKAEQVFPGMKIAVLNFSSNNGGTAFKDEEEYIQSKENRLIAFDASLQHSSVHCTDSRYRLVMNIVYFPEMSQEERDVHNIPLVDGVHY